jgi:hypothetical protein
MVAAIGADRGATLTLDAPTLRALYNAYRSKVRRDPKGLATYALERARSEEYGSVLASKTQLADLILGDLLKRDAEVMSADWPIVEMLVSVFRVT